MLTHYLVKPPLAWLITEPTGSVRPCQSTVSQPDGVGSLADTVIVSNRGPLAFHLEDGVPVAGEVGGGLAGSLHPLVSGTDATWVASAMGEADRVAVADGLMAEDGLRIELVEPEPAVYNMAYNVVSNAILWFCHHHLFDASRRPRADQRWMEAWDGYREFNQLFAERVAKVAPEGGRVLVQDYHLALVGSELARLRPDLRTAHFTHTPFADPSVLRMLPTAVGAELLGAMAGFGTCGFHTERWATAYRACQSEVGGRSAEGGGVPTFVSPLSTDPVTLRRSAEHPAVAAALARIEERVGGNDRQVVVRVDRMELSKNLLRGFWAYEELLESQPHRRERVVFVALAYPTRQGLPEYLAYQSEVESTVARINERWGTPGLDPDRPRGRGRLPPVAGRVDPLRRAAGQSGSRRAQPGGQGGAGAQHPGRRGGAVARGRCVRGAGWNGARGQSLRGVGHCGSAGRGLGHGRSRASPSSRGHASHRPGAAAGGLAGHPADGGPLRIRPPAPINLFSGPRPASAGR